MPNIAGITNYFPRAYENTVPMTLTSTIVAGAATVPVTGMTNYVDGDVVAFVVDGATPALKQVFTGTKVGGNVTGVTWTEFPTGGVNVGHAAGATVVDYVTATHWDLFRAGLLTGFNPTGGLLTSAVQAALNITGGSAGGWTPLGFAPSGVVCNGNRSYTLTFAGQNLTSILSPGMRLQTNRTVAAPTQSTTLNGTNQFWSKAAPAGMTFVNNFVASAWIKLSSYPAAGNTAEIASRTDGTSGWTFWIDEWGRVCLNGRNAGAGNFSRVTSFQAVPLNKWVHVAAQLDMATFTASPTTSYTMIDGVDVPAFVNRSGTLPTAIVQAGNLNIGCENGGTAGTFFTGKIAQVAIYSAKVTQATVLASISQTLTGAEASEISAYSFNGNANDLNVTNANNLTANNGVAAVTADSPYGGQSSGAISSTIDYGIVQSAVFSINTTAVVQVPEGCTIPTTGGVTSVFYSGVKVPYLFPAQRGKWQIVTKYMNDETVAIGSVNAWIPSNMKITVPAGEWQLGYQLIFWLNSTVVGSRLGHVTLSDSVPTNAVRTQDLTAWVVNTASVSDAISPVTKNIPYSAASATVNTVYGDITSASGSEIYRLSGLNGACFLTAENAYL